MTKTMPITTFVALALIAVHAMAAPIAPFMRSSELGKSGCVAVDEKKCGTTWKNNCLKCRSGSDYDCLKCCPGCTLVSKGAAGYCMCKNPSPSPPTPVPGVSTSTGNMTWAGKQRQYMLLVPQHPPTGMIVVLDPVNSGYLPYTCPLYANVTGQTGALVVCPAALEHPGTKGNSTQTCWKAWANFGTCGVTEDSEDVDFLAALIQQLVRTHSIPEGKVIMSGMSNGGSMAFRFSCEKSELIGGLAIQSQAYFDPYVGYYDYVRRRVPTGVPQCKPTFKRPFYSDVGTIDVYYGPNVSLPGFRAIEKWRHNYSTAVLGCTGEVRVTSKGPHEYPHGTGPATCYEYLSCPGITGSGVNRFCSVPGMGHDATGFLSLLPAAFADFF